jgi:hypothetical protein
MSASLSALGFGAFAGNQLVSLLLTPQRAIGMVIPDCVFSEDHIDTLEITEQPVEKTADITDHAYMKPPEVTIRLGFSNASLGAIGSLVTSAFSGTLTASGVLGTLTDGIGGDSYAVQSYNKLLALQASRVPFAITTGKRNYVNMLIRTIAVHTDATYEYSLMATVHCKQVNLVSTFSTTMPPNSNQAQAQTTASPQSTGTQSPAPTTNFDSLLKGGSGYLGSLVPSFGGG